MNFNFLSYILIGTMSCPYDEDYRCPQSGICIRSYEICDGYLDCPNGEDEQNCSKYIFDKMNNSNSTYALIKKITLGWVLLASTKFSDFNLPVFCTTKI